MSTDLDPPAKGSKPTPAVPPRKAGGRKPSTAPFSAAASKGPRSQPKGQQASFKARKRRRQQLFGGGIIGVVVIIIAVVVVVGLGSKTSSGPTGSTPVATATLASVESITPAEMASDLTSLKSDVNPPIAAAGSGAALTSGGKPEVLYMGAEYCPYCAGERWSMVLALSQFGTFSGLRAITSAANDDPASIPTFTFLNAKYSSAYVAFTSVEEQTVTHATLQVPTPAQDKLFAEYDAPPYVSAASAGGIPFIDFGNYSVQDGLGYSADTSLQHETFASVANQISTQTETGGQIVAAAGALVSNICHIDGGKSLNGNAACKAFPTPITRAPAGA